MRYRIPFAVNDIDYGFFVVVVFLLLIFFCVCVVNGNREIVECVNKVVVVVS